MSATPARRALGSLLCWIFLVVSPAPAVAAAPWEPVGPEGGTVVSLALDPASQGAAYELARIHLSRGEGEKAVKILENLLALAPDDPDCLYNLACCHARNRNFDDSLHYLKQAIEKGFRDLDKINADEDLTYIRQFKEYNQLAGQSGLI